MRIRSNGSHEALQAATSEIGDAKKLRGMGRYSLKHHSQTTDAFTSNHAAHCQLHLGCRQAAFHHRDVAKQIGISLDCGFQGADLFAASIN
jgi:hypothetical protein